MPVDSGDIIVCIPLMGQSWAFPSEELDGFFYYHAAALMSFTNGINFYDFRTGTDTEIISGSNEDSAGYLEDELDSKRLIGKGPGFSAGVTGQINRLSLLNNGSLLFETEESKWYTINFDDQEQLKVSDANETVFDPNNNFVLNVYNLDENSVEEFKFKYREKVEANDIKIEFKDRELSIFMGEKHYLIQDIKFSGVQLSQDAKKLAVFGEVSALDIISNPDSTEPKLLFATEKDKKEKLKEIQKDLDVAIADSNSLSLMKGRVLERLCKEVWNISIVYDLSKPPFVENATSQVDEKKDNL